MTGIPLFPAGIVQQYVSPISFYESIDLSKCAFTKYEGSTKLRTEKFNNILLDPLLKDLKAWIEIQAKDYLENVLGVDYEEFFFSESWVNINGKGGEQKVHNHSNSIISGTYYLKSENGHPPLDFHNVKHEMEPFISLTEHYKEGNPNTSSKLSFPSTQDTMLIFNSQLYHGHMANELEENRIGLSWNGLINFHQKDKNLYRIKFVKEEK